MNYLILYGGEVVKIDPAVDNTIAVFDSPEEAWKAAEKRSRKYGTHLDKYEVARLTPLKRVTKTIITFEESN